MRAAPGPGFPASNLTPRGLILNLGRGYWVGFRHRPAARRRRVARQRRDAEGAGARLVPRPRPQDARRAIPRAGAGRSGLARERHLPGWQTGARPSLDDPREPAPSPEEVGRGPLPEGMGRFNAVRLVPGGVVLEYTAGRRQHPRMDDALGGRRSSPPSSGISTSGPRPIRCGSCWGSRENRPSMSLSRRSTRRPRDAAGPSDGRPELASADAATMWAVRDSATQRAD